MLACIKEFKYHLIIFVLLLFAHGAVPAQELPKDAQKYVAEYESDVFKLQKTLAGNLNKSLAKAMKAGDLEGANAIKAKIEDLEKQVIAAQKEDLLGVKNYNPVGSWEAVNGKFSVSISQDQTWKSSASTFFGTWEVKENKLILTSTGANSQIVELPLEKTGTWVLNNGKTIYQMTHINAKPW